jgi:hypothetical protein
MIAYKVVGETKEVQLSDKIGTKLLFEDENFQSNLFKTKVGKFLRHMDFSIKETCSEASDLYGLNHPQTWAENANKLKQLLVIAKNDYRIHHCMPGSPFNPEWMKAENVDGFAVKEKDTLGKVVAICLFSALVEQEPAPFSEARSSQMYWSQTRSSTSTSARGKNSTRQRSSPRRLLCLCRRSGVRQER